MIDIFRNMHFENAWAWYLLALPLVLGLWYSFALRKQYGVVTLSTLQGLGTKLDSAKLRMRRWLPYFYLLVMLLIIICIARPKGSSEGISIVIATDISGSMGAQDLRPNRLAAALQVAEDFIKSRPRDRIGLVVFKAEAFTQCPITTDHDALLEQLSKLQPYVLTDGTAIGLGLGTAVSRLKESKSKSKVIILLTDGANNAGFLDPETASEMAKVEKIRVYTIAVGNKNTLMEQIDPATGQVMLGQSDFDEKLLKSIATKTNGKFYNASDNGKLEQIFKDIDLLEKNIVLEDKFSKSEELFFPFALLAFIILVLLIILQTTYLKSIS